MRSNMLCAVTMIALTSGTASAAISVPVKIGQTAAGYQADIQACDDLAKTWHGDSWTGLPPPIGGAEPISPFYGGAGGAGLALIALSAWADSAGNGAVRARLQGFCMKDRRYAIISLTDQEGHGFPASRPAQERATWLANLAADAVSERIRAATAAEPTPLPPARNEPFTIGAIRIAPSSLSLASGVVVAKNAVVTGRASHRLTARLKDELTFPASRFQNVRVEAGTEFMQFLSPAPWIDGLSQHMTLWCQLKPGSAIPWTTMDIASVWCLRSSDHDYEVVRQTQPPWFPTSVADITYSFGVPAPVTLVVDAEDGLGALDVVLRVEEVSPKKVTLAAQVTQGGKTAIVWRGAEPFDGNGRAELPFWTKRLVLIRDQNGVRANWEDGDGRSWVDQPAK